METLYSNKNENLKISGIFLPQNWINLDKDKLTKQARNAISELSQSTNLDLTAQELGFINSKHLIEICFDYILKKQ
jgi:hypothetical protein